MLDTQDFLNNDIQKIQNPGTSIQEPVSRNQYPGSANTDPKFTLRVSQKSVDKGDPERYIRSIIRCKVCFKPEAEDMLPP